MNQTTEYLTARELAKRLRVSPETIGEWARQGVIPTLRLSRKVIRYELPAVIKAMTARSEKGASNV